MFAPQKKMISVMRNGSTVQPISSIIPPATWAPTAFGWRLRYLMAKYTTRPAISKPKNPDTARRKKYRASTRPAIVEAPSGNNGVPGHMPLNPASCGAARSFAFGHHENEHSDAKDRGRTSQLHHAHNREAVAARREIVVIAV